MDKNIKMIRHEINNYVRDRNSFWKDLSSNNVAEWALLVTIGCLGISKLTYQCIAFAICIYWFFGNLKVMAGNRKGSFKHQERNIEKLIDRLPTEHKIIVATRFEKIKKGRKSLRPLNKSHRFLIAYTFLLCSSIYVAFYPAFFKISYFFN